MGYQSASEMGTYGRESVGTSNGTKLLGNDGEKVIRAAEQCF